MLPQGRLTLDQATRKNTSSSKRRWRPDSVATHYRDVPPIKCLPSELSQAFLALLMNSVQAVGTAGTISVDVSCDEDGVSVTIHDSGVGISRKICRISSTPSSPPSRLAQAWGSDYRSATTLCKSMVAESTLPASPTRVGHYVPDGYRIRVGRKSGARPTVGGPPHHVSVGGKNAQHIIGQRP